MSGRPVFATWVAVLAVIVIGAGAAGATAAGKPPLKHPPKHGRSVSVGISYANGFLILSTGVAGRAQIIIRSADGHRHWLKTVRLHTPSTMLPLSTTFPTITSGRYRVVVRPLFDNGFLSGAWITVA